MWVVLYPKPLVNFFFSRSVSFLKRRNESFVFVRDWQTINWWEQKICWRITACWGSRRSGLWQAVQVWEPAQQTELLLRAPRSGRQGCLEGFGSSFPFIVSNFNIWISMKIRIVIVAIYLLDSWAWSNKSQWFHLRFCLLYHSACLVFGVYFFKLGHLKIMLFVLDFSLGTLTEFYIFLHFQ